MSKDIEPALKAEEWDAEIRNTMPGRDESVFLARSGTVTHIGIRSQDTWRGEPYTGAIHASRSALAAVIALANAALPNSDPRKITREKVDALRLTLLNEGSAFGTGRRLVQQLADALESYLRPTNDDGK